jgi:Tol biopolymer transport system component
LLVLCVASIVAAACSDDPPLVTEVPTPPPSTETEPETPVVDEILFVDRTTLKRYSLSDGDERRLVDLPGPDVDLSPDGTRWAGVKETDPSTASEGYNAPVVVVGNLDGTGERIDLGPGRSPTWSADGTSVLAVVSQEGYRICGAGADPEKAEVDPEGEGCFDAERVVSYDASGGSEPSTAIGAGSWSILGATSAGDVIATSRHNLVVAQGFPGATAEQITELPFQPQEVWGISPVGDKILAIRAGQTQIADLSGQVLATPVVEGALADGAWSPDGRFIGAALITNKGRSALLLIDTTSGVVTEVPESAGAQGNVLWAPGATAFAYVRPMEDNRSRLEAVVCEVVEIICKAAFSWDEGVKLLSLN